MRNFGAVRSEFKSHLLHGTFLANFDGFTAGKPLFIDRWSGKTRRQAWLDSSFNHLTLLGADYGAWSMSYGYYFPSFAVAQGEEFRELTAAKASPAFHFGYIQNAWQVDLFLFNTNYQEDIGTKVEDVYDPGYLMRKDGSLRSYSKRSIPQSVRLTSTSARLNGQWFPTEDLKLGADVAFTRTGYKESALRRNTPMPGENDEFDPDSSEPPDFSSVAIERIVRQQLWAARTGVHIDLGQWVALSGEALLEHATTEGALGDEENLKKSDFIKTYVLVMELLL
jgi:hypothetical protein